MGFETYARRVRNRDLPYGHRHGALRSAVHLYKPLGFTATWDYLAAKAGRVRADENALLRALDVLEISRAAWHAEKAAFAARRTAEKKQGYGVRQDEVRYRNGFRWPGPDAHEAMYATVEALWADHAPLSRPAPEVSRFPEIPGLEPVVPAPPPGLVVLDASTADCVRAYLRGDGRLDRRNSEGIRRCAAALRKVHVQGDHQAFQHFRRLSTLVELILHGALPLIRRGWIGDAAAIRQVFLDASAGKPYLREVDPDVGIPDWIQGFLDCGRFHEIWVAELHGRVVGFTMLTFDQLGYFYVSPEAQNRGIGTDLLAHAKRRRPGRLILHTPEANSSARRFYVRHGFAAIGVEDAEVTYSWPR
ncbi:GNAT family N-acetyltransferase [Planotetraspora sp. A-T 1434]|uniref:GNAT family N-acetyltransferase n=1 Tax=Planotetraspora sp. A-T 1434 TaxID=2979219 RepID=UPI0021BF8E52|nr:GNAT family N-acetyltransferase [Planotetraspora sp. A-T 1434]MCT9933445.1 GNAT family N-acetyltransferase [Planotetraspora sp. A-T 1434]